MGGNHRLRLLSSLSWEIVVADGVAEGTGFEAWV